MACENTAEATKAGLAAGITAVELDISMSQDKVFIISDQTKTLKNHFSSKKHLQTSVGTNLEQRALHCNGFDYVQLYNFLQGSVSYSTHIYAHFE